MRPDVDVVVVSYERRDLLLGACRSALEAGAGRLIVVDNASTDGSADAVAGAFPSARLIRLPANQGFARAVNRGVAAGGAGLVLLLNSDARITGAALSRLVETVNADPTVAAAGPRIRGPEGELELSVGRTMGPLGDLRTRLVEAGYRGGRGPLAGLLERRYGRPREASALSAACLLLRREALEQVEGFDERFFLYAEDVDLCLRLRRAGWRLRYAPSAEVIHVRGASGRADPVAVERAWRSSQLAFYRKHHPRWAGLLRRWVDARYRLRSWLGPADRRRRAREMRAWLAARED